jgi:hypothetical protein
MTDLSYLRLGVFETLETLDSLSNCTSYIFIMGWFSGSSNNDETSPSTIDLSSAGDEPPMSSPVPMSGTGPKAQLMQRIQQEAAMANARALVTVCYI